MIKINLIRPENLPRYDLGLRKISISQLTAGPCGVILLDGVEVPCYDVNLSWRVGELPEVNFKIRPFQMDVFLQQARVKCED